MKERHEASRSSVYCFMRDRTCNRKTCVRVSGACMRVSVCVWCVCLCVCVCVCVCVILVLLHARQNLQQRGVCACVRCVYACMHV